MVVSEVFSLGLLMDRSFRSVCFFSGQIIHITLCCFFFFLVTKYSDKTGLISKSNEPSSLAELKQIIGNDFQSLSLRTNSY